MVPDCERACCLIIGELLLEPSNLRRGLLAATHFFAHRVEDHYVPFSQVVAIVAFVWVARSRTKVVEVSGSPFCVVAVVAGRRLRTPLVASPCGVVAVHILGVRSASVEVVPCGAKRPLDVI